jgi:L-amino acid N-acyltransferase YncA
MDILHIADPSDAAPILEIYGPYVLNTAFTFELDVPSVEMMTNRIEHYLEKWPWLIYLRDNMVVGYAYASPHRERAAYQWCVESSVYVRPDFQIGGLGTKLYNSLFAILKFQGFRNVYAGITLPNDRSVGFHKKLGFRNVGDYNCIGYKLGQWHTVSWWHYQLNNYENNPSPPLKFSEIDRAILQRFLK